jgi:hypothetical protein
LFGRQLGFRPRHYRGVQSFQMVLPANHNVTFRGFTTAPSQSVPWRNAREVRSQLQANSRQRRCVPGRTLSQGIAQISIIAVARSFFSNQRARFSLHLIGSPQRCLARRDARAATEPPSEDPPGNPQPDVIPPPIHEPGETPPPDNLPGKTPDEIPSRRPNSPTTPG